ncbi:MAG: glycogen debranching protein GlgX [Chitinophagaceae bacterium]
MDQQQSIYPGKPFPLGAHWDGAGVNFALYSEHATAVFLCLFDADEKENTTIQLSERSGYIWHVYLPGMKPGQLYGWYVDGPFEPQNGHRFNRHKLLLDPYAKALAGTLKWNETLYGYKLQEDDLSFNDSSSAESMPKCVVTDPSFDWGNDQRLSTPWHKTIIYELHVKGFTKQHPDIPEELRGTYAALGHPVVLQYLKDLGVTAVELMPVHYFTDTQTLSEQGLSNYWGYNTICFLAPESRYSSRKDENGAVLNEFKEMVKALHGTGIEVILDVVFNHTAEGNEKGPTLSLKGIDNSMYYRLAEDARYYNDYTGTGNTLNTQQPAVLRLIMDSLRYWIEEMHVDGFRFDLASALARGLHEVDRLSSFFDIIYQDPVISQVKLIAEPWDIGEGGYQVGNFPPGWSEWNGRYRDCIRNFWRGENSGLGEFAERITGSSDLYKDDGRKPTASINFITAHDGFTLADLVSYNEKHNDTNGEDNRDGQNDNLSWNCGAEGPTDNEEVLALRRKQQKNLLTTLFLSQGVPMLLAGDESGRTQQGNNNAYCQDNEISWLDWQHSDTELLDFTRSLIRLNRAHPVFQHKGWFQGMKIHGADTEDIAWFRPDGSMMNDEDWDKGFAKSLGIYLSGKGFKYRGPEGELITDDNCYLIFNASGEDLTFRLPQEQYGTEWKVVLNTANGAASESAFGAGSEMQIESRSVCVLLNPHKG